MTTFNPAATSPSKSEYLPTLTLPKKLRQCADVARRAAVFLFDLIAAPWAFVFAFFGIEVEQGYMRDHWMCLRCGDLHKREDECPDAVIADCSECVGVVTLDIFGACVAGRYHVIANRRLKFFHSPTQEVAMRK